MQPLATLFRAAQLYAHNAHHLAKGPTFFEDHEFFGDAYAAYETAYDSVVERIIGLGLPIDVTALQCAASTTLENVPPPTDNATAFGVVLEFESQICAEIERLDATEEITAGTANLIEGLADESEVRQYKIRQRLA